MYTHISHVCIFAKFEIVTTKSGLYYSLQANVNKVTYNADNNYNNHNYTEVWSHRLSWYLSWAKN